MTPSGISQEPIRKQVTRLLVDRLLSGQLEPGTRINESRLAEELGISRTPLREALLRLCFEGFLENEKGKGFSVVPLNAERGRQLYAVAGLLEGVALEQVARMPDGTLRDLESLEEERQEARQMGRYRDSVDLDHRWHRMLVRRCGNSELLQILEVVKKRLYRYEYLLADEFGVKEDGLQHHRQILAALRDRNHVLAVEQLKHHWTVGAERRMDWLEEASETRTARWTSLM